MATQSYAIYIRYPNEQTNNKCIPNQDQNNNTKPIDTPSGSGSSGGGSDSGSGSTGGGNGGGFIKIIKNPMGALVGGASKAIPVVAGVLLTAKIADSIVEAVLPYYEGYTGDYRVGFNYSNAKSVIGAVMNPIGTLNNVFTKQMEMYRENLKVQEQRLLTGNSIVNTYGGRTSN